jgi:tetratricopeptide (TPR) repeat protein
MRDDLGVGIEQILRSFPRTAEDAIVSLLMGRPILFVGYAGRDPDLLTLVNRITEASPAVAWVGIGSATGTAKRLSESYEHVVYSGDGSPACFAALGSHLNTHPEVIPGEWERRIHDWCTRQDTDSLAQAIASLCLERNEIRTRKTVLSIHSAIRNKAPKHQLWCLERRCELLLRSERPDDKEILFLENELELLSQNMSIPQKLRLKAIISLSSLYFRSGGIDKALHLLQATIEEVDDSDNTSLIELMISLGTIQTYCGGNVLDDARATLVRARDLAEQCQDPILRVNASQRLAVLLMRTNHEVEAVAELEALGPIIREIGAPRRTMVWRVNLAEANRISRLFDAAIALNTETLRLARNYGDEEVVMNCGQNQGLCLLSVGNIIQANQAFRNSLLLAQERVGGECIGNALYNLGWLRVIVSMWSSAGCWLKRAADEYAKYGAGERCGGALALKAWCDFRRGNVADVQVALQKIEQNHLIPSSFLSADLQMVKAAMSWLEDNILPDPGEVLAKLGGKPEQIFYVLTWLIDERLDEYTASIRQEMLQMAVEAVEESGLVAYYSILSDLIYRLGLNEPIALIKNIERRMHFKLSDIVQAISRNEELPNIS